MPELEQGREPEQTQGAAQTEHGLPPSRKSPVFVISLVAAIVISIGAVIAGALMGGRSYVVASIVVVICAIVPFFVQFESRRPQARELVTIAVMCALAVAARVAFIWVPHFKPMAAIIMISGVAFGASSGFLVGSVAALASGFIFGQGPWTPWQMLAFGLCGCVFGLLADKGVFPRNDLSLKRRTALSVCGGLFIIVIAGPVLDTSSLFYMISSITPEAVAAVYIAGFPVNVTHGIATFLTLLLLANPILSKLQRVRRKYGMS